MQEKDIKEIRSILEAYRGYQITEKIIEDICFDLYEKTKKIKKPTIVEIVGIGFRFCGKE